VKLLKTDGHPLAMRAVKAVRAGNKADDFSFRVLSVVRRIPPGRVATYGRRGGDRGAPTRGPRRRQHHARV
jgi:hypothetical protein